MRVRFALVLIALLAIVAVPSEATLVEQSGSVVDQVTSCLQPNGLVREIGAVTPSGERCGDDGPARAVLALLAVVALLSAGLLVRSRAHPVERVDERWRLPAAVARAGAAWRAPPRPV